LLGTARLFALFSVKLALNRLDQNMLTGTLSTRLGDLDKLEDLRLGENGFTGTLPPQITRLMELRKRYSSRQIESVSSVFDHHHYHHSHPILLSLLLQESYWSTTPTWKV